VTDATPEEAARRVGWTDERRRLHDLLAERSPEMAGFYAMAVDTASQEAEPGTERVRRSVIGHCMRELFNNLPYALDDVEGLPERTRNSDALTEQLVQATQRITFDSLTTTDTEVGALVTIDAEFVYAARAYADDAEAVKGRNKQRDSAVVLGRVEPANPAVRPWTAARTFFMRVTHVNKAPKHDPTSPVFDDELCAHFERVEAALMARLGNFFESFHALDDVLAEANAVSEGTDV
jgi:hypothetical protein